MVWKIEFFSVFNVCMIEDWIYPHVVYFNPLCTSEHKIWNGEKQVHLNWIFLFLSSSLSSSSSFLSTFLLLLFLLSLILFFFFFLPLLSIFFFYIFIFFSFWTWSKKETFKRRFFWDKDVLRTFFFVFSAEAIIDPPSREMFEDNLMNFYVRIEQCQNTNVQVNLSFIYLSKESVTTIWRFFNVPIELC